MKFYNNKEISIKFSIGGINYLVKPGAEFNLRDSVARVVKNKLLSYGLNLTQKLVQAPEGEGAHGGENGLSEPASSEETKSEEAPVEEPKEAKSEEAPRRRGRPKKSEE